MLCYSLERHNVLSPDTWILRPNLGVKVPESSWRATWRCVSQGAPLQCLWAPRSIPIPRGGGRPAAPHAPHTPCTSEVSPTRPPHAPQESSAVVTNTRAGHTGGARVSPWGGGRTAPEPWHQGRCGRRRVLGDTHAVRGGALCLSPLQWNGTGSLSLQFSGGKISLIFNFRIACYLTCFLNVALELVT